MASDLANHIQKTPVADTHEHLRKEAEWVEQGPPDVLADLFSLYAGPDLITAGADPQSVQQLIEPGDLDIESRFTAIEPSWCAARFTGYGQAVRLVARHVYGIDELTVHTLEAAQPRLEQLRQPGQRLHILRDLANLDHVQVDDFQIACLPDPSGPDFFLYDLRWVDFVCGNVEPAQVHEQSGVTVTSLATLRQAFDAIFDRYGPFAIAVKTQHAYLRSLRWQQRSDGDAEQALQKVLRNPDDADEQARLCLGDWCLARGVELAIEHNLPVKIHTGYHHGNNSMQVEWTRVGHLCPLLIRYPRARFVLMHISYPYSEEMIAVVKHFANAWADLCWAWAINPRTTGDFVRRFLHAAPINKLFAFGGDTFWPTNAYAYAIQMRVGLTESLQMEIDHGTLTEPEAIEIATRVLYANQYECFDIEGTRSAIRKTAEHAARVTT